MSPNPAKQPPRVALETTILSHGAPRRFALDWAEQIENAVIAAGAAPTTIGVMRGCAVIGMTREQLTTFLQSPDIEKANSANLAALRLKDRCRVYRRDALEFAGGLTERHYDIALADPPYRSRMLDRLVDLWLQRPFSIVLSVEHAADHELPEGGRRHLFGSTAITTFGIDP